MVTFEQMKAEFNLQGYYPPDHVIKAAVKLLNSEGVEFGEIGISAFVLGYTLGLSQILTK